MKKISYSRIENAVSLLVQKTAITLPPDVKKAIKKAFSSENRLGKETLKVIIDNAEIAKKKVIPLCQDTGLAVVFCEVGKDVAADFTIYEAVNSGIRKGTALGNLRRSVVDDPVSRENTGSNIPAVIHMKFTRRRGLKISVLLKGFGSENKSALCMFNPTASLEDIKDWAIGRIKSAGASACPPFFIGIGIGGTSDTALEIAKEALFEKMGERKKKKDWESALEDMILKDANKLGIGPLGFGGKFTVIDVKVKSAPTHIAGLPVGLNISCHSLRRGSVILR